MDGQEEFDDEVLKEVVYGGGDPKPQVLRTEVLFVRAHPEEPAIL